MAIKRVRTVVQNQTLLKLSENECYLRQHEGIAMYQFISMVMTIMILVESVSMIASVSASLAIVFLLCERLQRLPSYRTRNRVRKNNFWQSTLDAPEAPLFGQNGPLQPASIAQNGPETRNEARKTLKLELVSRGRIRGVPRRNC